MNTVYAYESFYGIVVESESHDMCLANYNRVKALAKAFNACIVKETKSARIGDVLNREIQIRLKAYAHETIIFRDALDIVIESINTYEPLNKARYHLSEIERIDARFGLSK